ncbi:MAG: hypothetical protein H8E98_07150 [Bacteroidetes bacterium]|nr:hypothetical protein [Bacteroidota bacterium]
MTNENDKNKLVKESDSVPSKINLGPSSSIDLSFLPENERKTLLVEYSKGILDINKKAQELYVDAVALEKVLGDLSETTKEVSESGNAVTITHSQNTKLGRTEIMMGNTEQAQVGKLSKSQTGEKDWIPFYILGGIIAIIVIVALMYN